MTGNDVPMPSVPTPDDLGAPEPGGSRISRRQVLVLAAAGSVAAAVGGTVLRQRGGSSIIGPESSLVSARERERVRNGRVATYRFSAAPGVVDLAGTSVKTWLYDGRLPGREVRVRKGDTLEVSVRNELPVSTSVHWHGLALRNDMDGVPGVTMPRIAGGETFDYRFVVPDAGTYWFHPHTGVQLDRGLYAPLIVEDPDESSSADIEHVVVLDDWLDGMQGRTPDTVFEELGEKNMTGMGMDGMEMGKPQTDAPLGEDGGDVPYDLHLVNGRPPADPAVLAARPGQRVRLRLINAAADTAYRVALGGHRLTVTHADGFPVHPVKVDTLVIGMGERYDVMVEAGSGAFPLIAAPESKADEPPGFAVLRTGPGRSPDPSVRPAELRGALLTYDALRPRDGTGLRPSRPARTMPLVLGMAKKGYRWTLNDVAMTMTGEGMAAAPLEVRADERVRLVMRNRTMMFHPMHVHGHTFALVPPNGPGTRKDTVIVPPMATVSVDLQTDNPGQWMVHCHNAYHAEAGMQTILSYLA